MMLIFNQLHLNKLRNLKDHILYKTVLIAIREDANGVNDSIYSTIKSLTIIHQKHISINFLICILLIEEIKRIIIPN